MDIYEEITRLRRSGIKAALATIVNVRGSIPSYESAKLLVREDGSIFGTVGGGCVEAEVWTAARQVIEEEKPRKLTFNLNQKPSSPRGLLTTTMADRETYANRERFPEAVEVYADDYEKVFERLLPNSSSFLIAVTRGHRDDMRVLRWAVGTAARYIGMIGSRRKVIEIVKYLEEKEGIAAAQLARVHSPIGLDIGAVAPEEIAVSVVAEMIAVRRGALQDAKPHPKSILAVS